MAGSRGPLYRFGPFALDADRRVLTHGETRIRLARQAINALLCLVEHEGKCVTKDDLVAVAWEGAAVTDNSLVQAVAKIREALAEHSPGQTYIETVPREGYRLAAPVEREDADAPAAADVDDLLSPFMALTDSRVAIESLTLDGIDRARHMLEGALRIDGRFEGTMVAMASALFFGFESTRADSEAPVALLTRTEQLARLACTIRPRSGHAWAILGVVRHRLGDTRGALAAVRKAVDLEPGKWLHQLPLAYVSAGEERLAAAMQTLALCPGVAYAHYFAATVYVARNLLDAALEQAHFGCCAQDAPKPGRLPGVGLHWLAGAILDAMGREDEALAEFERELEFERLKHVYSREACANSWYWIGAIHLRNGRLDEAATAFEEVLSRVPTHRRALAALRRGAVFGGSSVGTVAGLDAAIDMAVALALDGHHDEAARLCATAFEAAEPGSAGWQLPLEPILRPTVHVATWTVPLALLRERAR
ncbi:MAG: winged helix-turn-helix domain-containing protein [Vicinamibacterales bacterium]